MTVIGGGTMWGWIAYDPDLNLIYYGTANPGPWNQEQRPGDNKWTAGIFAREADTGAAKWFYQMNPHDMHDYDGINEIILLDLPVDGKMRKALLHPDRNGYLCALDRTTGEVLSADPYGFVNSVTGVDLKTGRPAVNPEKVTKLGTVVHDICPTASGAKDWNPSAYSPRTGLLYIPHENLCMDWENVQANYIAGTPYVGANVVMKAGPGGNRGEFTAWDPVQRKPAGKIKEDLPLWSGALATAGNLVFYGTMDGWFKAVDAKTGDLKWRFQTGSGVIGQPVAYRRPDGREFIAVLSGVGGWAGAIVSGNLDPRDPTGALGFVGAVMLLPFAFQARELRVCADPNNLPFSNDQGEGFENAIVALIARDLDATVSYIWWAQRRGFVRNTLKEERCDLWPGVASGLEMLATTRPYYRSTYVFVTRTDRQIDIGSFDDPQLRALTIGVQMVGNDAMNTPPTHALARRGIIENVRGYMLYGDYTRPNPPAAIVDAVAAGEIDVAVVWGPLAGYFAAREAAKLTVTPVRPFADGPQWPMVFDIAMGVRRGDSELKREIDHALQANRAAIQTILAAYHVPREPG
jgi:quinoprotein dehydrogenase-associated probable ABC transporter substrate-binding protein